LSCAVVLFTRDLRVRDQPALVAAVRGAERVIPLFVFDDVLLRGPCGSPNRVSFLLDCLRDLDDSLRERGGRLVVRRGDPVEEALRLARETKAGAIHLSDDYSAYARRRRERLVAGCERQGIGLRTHPGVTVVEPGELVPAGGDHYRVFTPYWRGWSELPRRKPHAAPRRLSLPAGVRLGRIPALRRLAGEAPSPDLPRGGETAARKRLECWLRGGLADYEEGRDRLAGDGTSHLSADLHFGCLSPAAVLEGAERRPGAAAFARQLCWRDFHHQVLAARPDLPRSDYRGRGDRWRRSVRLAEAWRQGRTGYPIVDAGMRQLAREGFMHNRARMIVASFLTKTLYGLAARRRPLRTPAGRRRPRQQQRQLAVGGGHRQRHPSQPGSQSTAPGAPLRPRGRVRAPLRARAGGGGGGAGARAVATRRGCEATARLPGSGRRPRGGRCPIQAFPGIGRWVTKAS
jgi:deoxyribodipyrimidine photo-lyase